ICTKRDWVCSYYAHHRVTLDSRSRPCLNGEAAGGGLRMEQFRIEIRYDGIDAGANVIDMRLFGESLIGLERALSTGLNTIAHGAIPRSRAKPTLDIKASPVRPGSVELD